MAPKSKLKAVDPKAAEPSKPKILIFGKPGVGKTWVSMDFPSCFYIDTEGGANRRHYTDKLSASGGMYFGPDQGSLSFENIIEQVQALATEEHEYKTLVIDSITKVFNVEIATEAERLGDKNAFGADKKPAVSKMRRLVNWLSRIDMNVILIAHEKSEWGLNNKGERTEVGVTFDCWDKLSYEFDLCFNIIKNGPSHIAKINKSRLTEFPNAGTFPWSYENFAQKYGADVIQRKSAPIEVANAEQLEEIKRLLHIVKLPEGQEEKWLKAAQIDEWSEMSSERIAKAIEHIKTAYLSQGAAA